MSGDVEGRHAVFRGRSLQPYQTPANPLFEEPELDVLE
jgi:hypothetical protein